MNVSTVIRKRDAAKASIVDTFNSGVQFKLQYLDISRRINAQIPRTLPQYAQSYLRGYADALLERINREAEFRYLISGQWINARDLEYSNDCPSPNSCEHSGHVAATRNPPQATFWPGTDKVFYQSVDHIYGRASAE